MNASEPSSTTPPQATMKLRVARSIKWNVVDKLASQVLYAVTGIVLARVLSQEDFGLVGAVMVFQAFATLFVDSGFSSALIQRKAPTRLDYSTVLWFNMAMAMAIYIILFFSAPLIADCFQGDTRLIPLSRVMFLSFIINATAIVQTNRLLKQMDVKPVAVSNTIGLIVSGAVGIILALTGYGAWAIVWQTIVLASVKSMILWAVGQWTPVARFSLSSLRSFFKVGMGIMGGSFLNILFQNIYSFIIGNRVGLVSLGYYTQADKWSKMGVASMSQVLTASFLPALSQYQDDPVKFAASTAKMNRFTSYLLFPAMGMLAVMATPLFHLLFGTKWDAAIALFCLLLLRGVFTVLTSLYNNYILALGRSRLIIITELLRDGAALLAIAVTLPYIALSTAVDITLGVRILLWGQVAAAAITWAITLVITARLAKRKAWEFVTDGLPYLAESIPALAAAWGLSWLITSPLPLLLAQAVAAGGIYMGLNALLKSKIQSDVIAYILKKTPDRAHSFQQ